MDSYGPPPPTQLRLLTQSSLFYPPYSRYLINLKHVLLLVNLSIWYILLITENVSASNRI